MNGLRWLPTAFLLMLISGGIARAGTTVMPSGFKLVAMCGMTMITDLKGLTLYVLDADRHGKPTCTGACARSWPPLAAAPDAAPAGDFTIVKRDDGSLQWAYRDRPLYYNRYDTLPSDMSGEGVDKDWHVATALYPPELSRR